MLLGLIIAPLVLGIVALLVPSNRVRPWLLPVTGALHLGLTALTLMGSASPVSGEWLRLDGLGRLVLAFVSVLFFLCSVYAPGYLRARAERPNRMFCACMPTFLAMMTLMLESHHLALMWVALESTTLSSGPLLFFSRSPRALEATWKYLLIGSVGIALALLGSFLLAYSAMVSGLEPSLVFEDLVRQAPRLSRPWLHSAFILLFVGYGTKMGLAPMHSWKPDAYGEAPGVVGTLLAGGLTSCAFVALLRFVRIVQASGDAAFAREIMIAAGLLSMAVAGVFMARQRDYKRMLAYSSVEHMGILVLGIGIGGEAIYGSLLHLVNNGLTKGVLFMSAGNIHRAYASKLTHQVGGALQRLPISAALFLAGFIAITGSPPFGPFISEFTILTAAIQHRQYGIAAAFLLFLIVVFIGMGSTVLAVVQGKPTDQAAATDYRDTFLTVAPPIVLLGLVLLLGVYIPAPLESLLRDAARFLEPGQ